MNTEYRVIIFSNLFIPKNKEHYLINENSKDNDDLAKEIYNLKIIKG